MTEPFRNNFKFSKKTISAIIILIAFVVLYYLSKKYGLLHLLTNVHKLKGFFLHLGSWSYIVYIVFCILTGVLMLPDFLLTIAAGIIFGPIKGTILALAGDTIGAILAFLIARYLARDFIVKKFGENIIFKKIDSGVSEFGATFLIITRLIPLFPFSLQSYAYGITSMKLFIFSSITFVAMIPGTFAFAYMPGDILKNGISIPTIIKLAIVGVILVLLSLLPKLIAKKKGIKLD